MSDFTTFDIYATRDVEHDRLLALFVSEADAIEDAARYTDIEVDVRKVPVLRRLPNFNKAISGMKL